MNFTLVLTSSTPVFNPLSCTMVYFVRLFFCSESVEARPSLKAILKEKTCLFGKTLSNKQRLA
jgi:hypothetical protein